MFSFQGRSTRAQFSEIVVADIVFVLVVLGAYWWLTNKMGGLSSLPMPVVATVLFVLCALVVPLAVATAATAVRRFHDRGKSGWWALSLLVVFGFLEGMFAKGTEGANEYGSETADISPALKRAMPQTPVVPEVKQEVKKEQVPNTVPSQASVVIPVAPVTPTAPAPVQPPVATTTPKVAPAPQATTPPTQSTPVVPQSQTATPPQTTTTPNPTPTPPQSVPPARSMAEMLAELQKLAAQESSMASKVIPKQPQAAPVSATPAQPNTQASAPAPISTPQAPQAPTVAPSTQTPPSTQPGTKTA
jgi:uncharacterized membrane protein YhaH (DUF805 family)